MQDVQQKQSYAPHEIDFARRLIAKFRFNPQQFWSDHDFPMIRTTALYPDAHDLFVDFTKRMKEEIERRFGSRID